MAWWAWLVVFVAISVLGAVVLFLQGRSLWRKAVAFFEELGTASDQIAEFSERLEDLDPRAAERATAGEQGDLAVFHRPADLRRAQSRGRRR